MLHSSAGRVVSRAELLRQVWGLDPSEETRTVDATIRRLRIKLGARAEAIETVPRVGYRLRA